MGQEWGLLGPEFLPSTRRTRTLGLGTSVRQFNDLTVPGIGGVWFGKQLFLATLGVVVAEEARKRGTRRLHNIEVANAIEALACILAFESNDWQRDFRLRGNSKLKSDDRNTSFDRFRQRNFYVTQPMRMVTVQALPALGLVEAGSIRFNSFQTSDAGTEFIETACKDVRPYNRSVVEHLVLWACNQDDRVNTDALQKALSPLKSMSEDASKLVRERLIQGGQESADDKQRRNSALKWVESLRAQQKQKTDWQSHPSEISEIHWHDMVAGALFFKTRDAAIQVLDALEVHIGDLSSRFALHEKAPEIVAQKITALRTAANNYLEKKHTNIDAAAFCRECIQKENNDILRSLVNRDGHVLRLVGDETKPGPAFRGAKAATNERGAEEDEPAADNIPLPDNISYRMRNLYLLNLDLHGELDGWLKNQAAGDSHEQ